MCADTESRFIFSKTMFGAMAQQNLEGGFAEGGGISQGFGGVKLCYVGSPKHVENPGIHRTIITKSTLYVASGTGGTNQR